MAQATEYQYGLLTEQAQEDALHSTRLLNVEERPFARVIKTLLSDDSLLRPQSSHLPSPPPDDGEDSTERAQYLAKRTARFREDVLLDFQNLENSIVRIQLVQSSNQRERERYAAEKAKILETAQSVRDNTVELRAQLVEAQKVLELRKGYDKLAEGILEDKKLKSRDDARADIERLHKEIEELQVESAEFEGVWLGRKEQFERVVAEGEAMRRLVKGIKDEPELGEESNEDETMGEGEGDAEGEDSGVMSKDDRSRIGTPRLDASTPRGEGGDETAMPESFEGRLGGDATPRPHNKFLEVEDGMRTGSKVGSPLLQPTEPASDVEMAESSQVPQNSGEWGKASTGLEAMEDEVKQTIAGEQTMDET